MDKKNLILGISCLFAAFVLMVRQEKQLISNIKETQNSQQAVQPTVKDTRSLTVNTSSGPNHPSDSPTSSTVPKDIENPVLKPAHEEIISLENDFIRVNFTTCGGAVRSVVLKKFQVQRNKLDPCIFNEGANQPALSLNWTVKDNLALQNYRITQQTKDFVQFAAQLPDGTNIVRGYRLHESQDANPYLIMHETCIESTQKHEQVYLSLGMFQATSGDHYQEYLNFGAFDGKKSEFIKTGDFEASSGFLGLGQREAKPFVQAFKTCRWGSIKNQFFTAIVTPQTPAIGYYTEPGKSYINGEVEPFITGQLLFHLNPGRNILAMDYYVGPKDFVLLNKMGGEQDQIMQFVFFGSVSKILLLSLRGIHSFLPNWGWAIIFLTFIIKLLMWPVTQAQFRSSKKMSSLQEPLKLLREKYKTNPQKLQAETLKLFKENHVNPALGCLPVMIQIPIFLGLYFMLRTSSEMRFQSFLWIKDLSVADTVAYLGAFPVNPLPILMGLTTLIQMKMTPMPSMDGMQQKIILLMPFIFLICCYNFPAALVLYWTVQNVFTILQQCLSNRVNNEKGTTEPNRIKAKPHH